MTTREYPGTFDEVIDDPRKTNGGARRVRFKLTAFEQIQISTAPNYLVKGIIPRAGLVIFWGPPKCGKSFLDLRSRDACRARSPISRPQACSKGASSISRSKAAAASPVGSKHGGSDISAEHPARCRSICSICRSTSSPTIRR